MKNTGGRDLRYCGYCVSLSLLAVYLALSIRGFQLIHEGGAATVVGVLLFSLLFALRNSKGEGSDTEFSSTLVYASIYSAIAPTTLLLSFYVDLGDSFLENQVSLLATGLLAVFPVAYYLSKNIAFNLRSKESALKTRDLACPLLAFSTTHLLVWSVDADLRYFYIAFSLFSAVTSLSIPRQVRSMKVLDLLFLSSIIFVQFSQGFPISEGGVNFGSYIQEGEVVSPQKCLDCNVLLVIIEAVREDRWIQNAYRVHGFFGNQTYFNAATASPCTIPSVLQFMSGDLEYRVHKKSIAQALRDRGYTTVAFTSQHLFTENLYKKQVSMGFDVFVTQEEDQVDHHGLSTKNATEITREAIDWLNENKDERFFLWLHYFEPHDPHNPPKSYVNLDEGDIELGDVRSILMKHAEVSEKPWQLAGDVFNDKEVEAVRDLYDGELRYVDFEVGRLLERVEQLGLSDETIIALTSDHGEWLGERERWDHCQSLHEFETLVPLYFRVGGEELDIPGESQMSISLLDLKPTILYLVGAEISEDGLEGVNLLAANEDRKVASYWEGAYSVRMNGFKMYYSDRPLAFYDTNKDPMELKDLLNSSNPEKKTILDFIQQSGGGNIEPHEDSIVDELRSIGYIP